MKQKCREPNCLRTWSPPSQRAMNLCDLFVSAGGSSSMEHDLVTSRRLWLQDNASPTVQGGLDYCTASSIMVAQRQQRQPLPKKIKVKTLPSLPRSQRANDLAPSGAPWVASTCIRGPTTSRCHSTDTVSVDVAFIIRSTPRCHCTDTVSVDAACLIGAV